MVVYYENALVRYQTRPGGLMRCQMEGNGISFVQLKE